MSGCFGSVGAEVNAMGYELKRLSLPIEVAYAVEKLSKEAGIEPRDVVVAALRVGLRSRKRVLEAVVRDAGLAPEQVRDRDAKEARVGQRPEDAEYMARKRAEYLRRRAALDVDLGRRSTDGDVRASVRATVMGRHWLFAEHPVTPAEWLEAAEAAS